MSEMFARSKFTSLDLSNFDTSKVNNTKEMFYKSLNFEKIYVNGYGTHTLRIKNTTIDKIYLLSARKVWKDTSAEKNLLDFENYNGTRALDYYYKLRTTNNYSSTIKKNGTSAGWWWLRSTSGETSEDFATATYIGYFNINSASDELGVSIAFRIGQHFLNKTSPHQIKRGLARKRNVK